MERDTPFVPWLSLEDALVSVRRRARTAEVRSRIASLAGRNGEAEEEAMRASILRFRARSIQYYIDTAK